MVLFLKNKQFNVILFLSDYQLRWWRLPIEERACRKTRLGGCDYQLSISALPPVPIPDKSAKTVSTATAVS